MRNRAIVSMLGVLLFCASCDVFNPKPSPSPSPTPLPTDGTGTMICIPPPSGAKLVSNMQATYRFALGLGPELPYNTWLPWQIDTGSALWFPVIAVPGRTYSVYWDDNWAGSSFGGVDTYSADIQVGAYLADKTTRLSGWPSDVDSGYGAATTFTVPSAQLVYIKVLPFAGSSSNCGTFGLQVAQASSSNSGESFSWYLDGAAIPAASSYLYILDPSTVAAGKHRLTAVGTRSGVSFSESYTFTK